MEIGALSTSPATRYISRASTIHGAADQVRQVPREAPGAITGQAAVQNTTADSTRNTNLETARKEILDSRDAQKANASSISTSQEIQFKDSGGTRVMAVYDSKDILIYQVPSKGQLALIHSQQHLPEPQVETSA